MNRVVRIERADDAHTISDKWFDFSYDTISLMIQEGIRDALKTLVTGIKKESNGEQAACSQRQLPEFINEVRTVFRTCYATLQIS